MANDQDDDLDLDDTSEDEQDAIGNEEDAGMEGEGQE
nr:DNA-directed RNA polymerase subunit delta [Acidobacteriota bacterium]